MVVGLAPECNKENMADAKTDLLQAPSAKLPKKPTRNKKRSTKKIVTDSAAQLHKDVPDSADNDVMASNKQTTIDVFCSSNCKSSSTETASVKETRDKNRKSLDADDSSESSKSQFATQVVSSPINVGFLKMSPLAGHAHAKHALVKAEVSHDRNSAAAKTSRRRRATQKSAKQTELPNHKLTDFYPIRRSSRKTKSLIKKEKEDEIVNAILTGSECGLQVVEFPEKGRGVVTTQPFAKGSFVVEYAGDLISWPEARKREVTYSEDPSIGCYMYYFSSQGRNYCIDATAETGRLGRLLNHGRRNPNCQTRLVWAPEKDSKSAEEVPHLVIVARKDIHVGEELVYDYGDRDKTALEAHPWLKS